MRATDINELIFEGDTVIDNMDDSRRIVSGFVVHDENQVTVNMEDGGVMGLDEISFDDIRIGWTDHRNSKIDPDNEAEKSGYLDDDHYRREMQAAYSDGQM